MTSKTFAVVLGGKHATAIRYDKKTPRVKRAAVARQWRNVQ